MIPSSRPSTEPGTQSFLEVIERRGRESFRTGYYRSCFPELTDIVNFTIIFDRTIFRNETKLIVPTVGKFIFLSHQSNQEN